ncbi:MAG TPA: oligosaccharide flippase family protein [Bacteroidota bacterium]
MNPFVPDALEALKSLFLGSKRGIRDVIMLMIPQVVALLAGLVTSVLAARGLGPSGLGAYALVLSVAGIATVLSDLGIGQTAVRYASRAVSRGDVGGQLTILRWAFRVRLILSLFVTIGLFLAAPFLADRVWKIDGLAPLLQLGLLGGVFNAFASVPNIYFQSMKLFNRNTIVTVGQTLISFAGICIVAWLGIWSVKAVLIASLAGAGIGTLAFLLMVPHSALYTGTEGFLPSTQRIRNLLHGPRQEISPSETAVEAAPGVFAGFNLVSTIIVMVVTRADVWLMGLLLNQHDIGIYTVGTRFALPLTIVLNAITAALWPRASASKSNRETVVMMSQTFRLCAIVALCGAVYAIVVPLLAPVLFGHAYAESVILGQVLSLRYALAILICPVGVISYSFGMVRVYWWINLVQLAVVLLINFVFLPRIGPLASALALVANEIIGVTFAGRIILKRIKTLP